MEEIITPGNCPCCNVKFDATGEMSIAEHVCDPKIVVQLPIMKNDSGTCRNCGKHDEYSRYNLGTYCHECATYKACSCCRRKVPVLLPWETRHQRRAQGIFSYMENPYSGWQFESFALLRQGQLVPACKWEFIVCNRCAGNKVGRKINEIAIERMKAIESLTIDYMSNLTKVVSQMQVVSAV